MSLYVNKTVQEILLALSKNDKGANEIYEKQLQ